ncbi:MAG: hypothetical protein ABI967_07940 [bacterium]
MRPELNQRDMLLAAWANQQPRHRLSRELLDKFFTPGLRDLYLKADKNSNAFYEKHRQETTGQIFKDPQSAGDPCNGQDPLTCGTMKMMKEFAKGITLGPAKPGLELRGSYPSRTFDATFWAGHNITLGCSDVNLISTYTIEREGGGLLVHVVNGNDTVTFAFRPDLTLIGPGAVAIHGFVPGGSRSVTTPGEAHQVTTTTQVEMNRNEVMAAGQQTFDKSNLAAVY